MDKIRMDKYLRLTKRAVNHIEKDQRELAYFQAKKMQKRIPKDEMEWMSKQELAETVVHLVQIIDERLEALNELD